jgi:hypothetical protein
MCRSQPSPALRPALPDLQYHKGNQAGAVRCVSSGQHGPQADAAGLKRIGIRS